MDASPAPAPDTRKSPRPPKLRGVEGLRGVAVLTVMFYHCWLYSSPDGGRLEYQGFEHLLAFLRSGRILFFVLSGFLLYRSFALPLLSGAPRPETGNYLVGRALRIIPSYWFALLLVALVFDSARVDINTLEVGSLRPYPLTLLADMLLVQSYIPSTVVTGIGPAWSLVVEVGFYLFLPLTAAIAYALARRGVDRLTACFAAPLTLFAIGFATTGGLAVAARLGLVTKATWTSGTYSMIVLSPPYNFDLFGYGMLLAAIEAAIVTGHDLTAWFRRLAVGAGLVATAVAIGFAARLPIAVPAAETTVAACVAIAMYVLILRAESLPVLRPFRAVLENRVLAKIGLVSYGIFLWNEPVVLWLRMHGYTLGGWGGLLPNYAFQFMVTFCFAQVTATLVEQPGLRLKSLFVGRLRPARPEVREVAPTQAPAPGNPDLSSRTA